MTVTNTTARNQYTATAGQTVFAYTFEVYNKNDLVVLQNDTTLAEGTNYTVSGVGSDTGGNITLSSGATAGDIITVYRDMALERLTDYQNAGDFLASEVNEDFDRLWLATQQNATTDGRAIRKPVSDIDSINMELPEASSRANKLLSFDGNGNVQTLSSTTSAATDATNVTYTATGTGAVGRTVQSRLTESISVKDFGAKGDGTTDDTAAIQAAIDYVNGTGTYGTVEIPPSSGAYIFTAIVNKTKVTLKGTGGILKFKDNTATNSGVSYYPIGNLTGTEVVYDGLIVDGNASNNTQFVVCDNITCTGEGSIVRNCTLLDAPDSGIMFSAATHGQCINNYIKGGTDSGIYVNNSSESSDLIVGAIVSGNVIQGHPYGGISIKRSAGYIAVTNNTIDNCGNGITIEDFGTGSGGEPDHLLIANNLVKDIGFNWRSESPVPAESGMNVQKSKHCVVSGNKFVNVSGVVFGLDGAQFCTVTGNNFRGYTTSPSTTGFGNVGAMFTTRSSVDPDYNVFSANIVSGCQDEGIYMVSGEYNVVTSNVVREIDGAGASNQAFRIDADGDNNIVSDNIFHAPTVDTGINAGALGNIFDTNKTPNATGTAINGIRRDTSNATPVGNVVPFYAGEFYYITTGTKLFFATGTTNSDWIELT
tara:strand:+ start:9956 stop:11905 length:1950 start_codon:yes stop_codon:yes gene_type:complete